MRNQTRVLPMLLAIPFFVLVGCSEPGPAEKAGQSIDKAVEDVRDKLDPQGPAESAGEKLDNAVESMKEAIDNDGPAENAGEKIDEATEKMTDGK
ncbi:MAG: hypothetical protein LPJ91_00050 [Pseudazoarcus pumilus]|nr:hypothetical protein [Pseudazoarcus pumilus]